MTFSIRVSKQAAKYLKSLDQSQKQLIGKAIDGLKNNPFPRGHQMCEGAKGLYRIRRGGFRIIYSVKKTELIILVVRIGSRGDIYKKI